MRIVPDVEDKVFDTAYTHIKALFPNVDMKSVPEFIKCGDLAVRLYEADNMTDYETLSLSNNDEEFANVMYEVQIRSNLKSGKKAQAKAVYRAMNDIMLKMGFVRTSTQPFFEDTVYRFAARYHARVDTDGNISWRYR